MCLEQLKVWLAELDVRLGALMERWGLVSLRFGVGVVYFWFGLLKPLGMSPAEQLVLGTTYWIPVPHFYEILGFWEMAIGLCFMVPALLRVGIILMFLHLPGTLLPFLLLPEQCFTAFPYALTLEGQYIIKNLVLAAAGLVVGGAIRHRAQGFSRFGPDEFNLLLHRASWLTLPAGETLLREGESPERVWLIHSGRVAIGRGDLEITQCGAGAFLGEMSFMSGAKATASVTTMQETRLLYWERAKLEELFEKDAKFQHAFMASINRDLVDKLQSTAG